MRALCLALCAACATAREQPVAPKPAAPALIEAPHPPPPTPDAEFRQSAPPPGKPLEFRPPVPRQLRLSNGVPVFLIERHEVPLVAVTLAVRSGADTDPPGLAGLSSMALDLLDEGSGARDAAAIARGFEDLAARYATGADADASSVSVVALADTLGPVLDLFADVVLRPAFRDADVERVRVERLGGIAQVLDDPSSVAQRVLSRMIFGEAHPWGYPGEGTVKSVKSIKRADLAAWHAAHFRPSNAALFVVGDVDEAAATALLEQRFGSWKDARAPAAAAHAAPARNGDRVITIVDKPGAPQSQIWIGEVGVSSTAPDVFPVRVMNHILGGSFNSRLNGNLRSEHGYSYGVSSFYDTHREAGPFVAEGGVVSDKTAESLAEFMRELSKMKTGEVTEAELADAKESLVRAVPALFTSDEQIAYAYARVWAHGLPADYYATYRERVEAVTRDDVAKAARERLHPERMAIVVVGPQSAIEQQIAALKLGRLEFRDAQGEARKAAAAASGAGK